MTVLAIASIEAKAQTDLSAYADANGFLNLQTLTCAQLANTCRAMPTGSRPGTAVGTTASRSNTT